jgi:D-sedoheptulose 7-phosphate isomerase
MNLATHIRGHFDEAIELKRRVAEALAPEIARAGEALAHALRADHKVLACGNGGSAADSQHFAAEIVGRFERERPGMPAIALTTDTSTITAIANDYSYDVVFAKQVESLRRPRDFLLGISTSGNSKSVVEAIKSAHSRKMRVIALTGRDGGAMAKMLGTDDFHLNVAHARTMRIQEVHLLVIHCLCEVVDNVIFGENK